MKKDLLLIICLLYTTQHDEMLSQVQLLFLNYHPVIDLLLILLFHIFHYFIQSKDPLRHLKIDFHIYLLLFNMFLFMNEQISKFNF